LKREVTFKPGSIEPICIPKYEEDAETLDGDRYLVMGWGTYANTSE